ncbi:MAG: hypothetical protein ABDI19_03615 [Armatimonadota bacterium]
MARRKKTISSEEPTITQPIEPEKPKRRRKKTETAPAAELIEQAVIEETAQEIPEPASVAPTETPAKRRRTRSRTKAAPVTPAAGTEVDTIPPIPIVEEAAAEPALPAPIVEEVVMEPTPPTPVAEEVAADLAPLAALEAHEVVETDIEVKPAPKRRARRRKAEPEASIVETPPEPVAEPTPTLLEDKVVLEALPEPVIIIRHPLARVHFHRGVPYLTFGERVLQPQLFFGNPHTPEAATRVHQQMQLASEAGISLFALLIPLPVRTTGALEAFDSIRYWTALAREVNPDALLLWRIVPVPVGNWRAEFSEAVIRFADGTVGGPSVCADRWWEIVQAQLTELARLVEQEEEGAYTLGYHLDWGEWFLPESAGYDTSEAATQAFREWLRRHFRNDTVSLRASWFNGEVSFGTATVPAFVPNAPLTKRQFYDPRREGRWIDYHQFIAEATARRILSLARAVKEACHRRCLVGASYGYVLEWRHPHSGHLALGMLLQSEDIDFLSAPITYADRLPGGVGACPVPVESVHLHHKLFLAEEDYRTPFGKVMRLDQPATEHSLTAGTGSEEDYNPPLRSADAVAQVQNRSAMQALVHGFGEAWMDLWGEGWLMHPAIWERLAGWQQWWAMRARVGQVEPDLAVIVDPMSLSYVRVGSPLIQQVVVQAREAVTRSGISFGFYLLDDVVRRDFPRSRLVLFLNAWNIKPSVREAIRRRLQRDGRTLIWLYAASLFDNHRHTLETAREVTGIALALQPWASMQGSQIINPLHPIARQMKRDKLGIQQRWEPSFYALDTTDKCQVIGEYIETGLPSLAVAEHDNWRAVFIGERLLTPELLRGIANWAGVHVWCVTNDVVHIRPPFVHLHASRGGEKSLNLPMPLCLYDLTDGVWVAEEVHEYRLGMNEGESRLFLVGTRATIEALLTGEGEIEEPLPLPVSPPQPAEELPEALTAIVDEEATALVQPLVVPSASLSEPKEAKTGKRQRAKKSKQAPSAPPADDLLQTIRWRKQSTE